jgi:hypothetical protein
VEALERRVGWLGLAIGVVLVWATLAGGGFVGRIQTWELIVFLSALFCLVAAGALIGAAMAPGGAAWLPLERREQFAYWALVFFVLALVLLAVRSSSVAWDLHNSSGIGVGQ